RWIAVAGDAKDRRAGSDSSLMPLLLGRLTHSFPLARPPAFPSMSLRTRRLHSVKRHRKAPDTNALQKSTRLKCTVQRKRSVRGTAVLVIAHVSTIKIEIPVWLVAD